MNWGYKIMFVYLLFVVGMLTLVYKCTQQNTELVADNYYDQEVKYQERYNKLQNASSAIVECIPANANTVDLMEEVNRVQLALETFLCKKSKLTRKVLQKYNDKRAEWFFDSKEALKWKIIDGIYQKN